MDSHDNEFRQLTSEHVLLKGLIDASRKVNRADLIVRLVLPPKELPPKGLFFHLPRLAARLRPLLFHLIERLEAPVIAALLLPDESPASIGKPAWRPAQFLQTISRLINGAPKARYKPQRPPRHCRLHSSHVNGSVAFFRLDRQDLYGYAWNCEFGYTMKRREKCLHFRGLGRLKSVE